MYSLHSTSTISAKKNISFDKHRIMNEDEIREMQFNWEQVEAKRDFVVGRINSLAKKFPQGAYDPIDETVEPTENEMMFKNNVDIKSTVKNNEQ